MTPVKKYDDPGEPFGVWTLEVGAVSFPPGWLSASGWTA
jgi:hypothetical protein